MASPTAAVPPLGDMGPKSYSVSDLPSPGISVEFHGDPSEDRPALLSHLSAPAAPPFKSPIRQHKRTPSAHREVKETLNARSEYTNDDEDGRSHHKINQYTIKEEIGRGSYGAVHLATDQFGQEFAVKEFSKARLSKRAKSNILRQGGPRRLAPFPHGVGFNRPMSPRIAARDASEATDALFLIRQEIAIMKKLNHPNLVQLIEVLDDPDEDSLYMVLEMCKQGVVMKVGLDESADPYPEEDCRCWFRDLILGIEYLHAQGVVHRDIKPDNLLLTSDNVLKIVDFGVSEMFDKPDNMRTTKSAGSPAFLPPELCVVRHGDVAGKACDIWSMGVSLYCLRYGRIPFECSGVLEMYAAIRTDSITLPEGENEDLIDLLHRLLEKDPDKRIVMSELREHPWVTKQGSDPLLSEEENCAVMVDSPNALEVNHAFTRRMSHLMCVMKAISKFKGLIHSRASTPQFDTFPGRGSKARTPRQSYFSGSKGPGLGELSEEDRQHAEHAAQLVEARAEFLRTQSSSSAAARGDKGHAHDPSAEEPRFLGIGTGGRDDFSQEPPADVVSDSPTAVDFNVYDTAYENEVKRIEEQAGQGWAGKMYMTKLVEKRGRYKQDASVVDGGTHGPTSEQGGGGVGHGTSQATMARNHMFADVVSQAVKEAKSKDDDDKTDGTG